MDPSIMDPSQSESLDAIMSDVPSATVPPLSPSGTVLTSASVPIGVTLASAPLESHTNLQTVTINTTTTAAPPTTAINTNADGEVAPTTTGTGDVNDDMQLDDLDTTASFAGSSVNGPDDVSVEERRMADTNTNASDTNRAAQQSPPGPAHIPTDIVPPTTAPSSTASLESNVATAASSEAAPAVAPAPDSSSDHKYDRPLDIVAEQEAAEAKAQAAEDARIAQEEARIAEEKRKAARQPVLYRMNCRRCDALLQFPFPSRLLQCGVCTYVNAVNLSEAVEHSSNALPEKSLQEQASQWSTLQVIVFLKSLKLEHLTHIFEANQVDGAQLLDLTYYDIRDILRIQKLADIENVLNCINILRGTPVPTPNDLVLARHPQPQPQPPSQPSINVPSVAVKNEPIDAAAAITSAPVVLKQELVVPTLPPIQTHPLSPLPPPSISTSLPSEPSVASSSFLTPSGPLNNTIPSPTADTVVTVLSPPRPTDSMSTISEATQHQPMQQ